MRLLRVCVCCLAVGHYFSSASGKGTTDRLRQGYGESAEALRAKAEVVPYVIGLAATQPKPSPDEFVAVTEVPESEQIPAIRLVATAYGFIWVVLLGYIWTVGKRLNTVEAELDELKRRR
jgi:CcmD family protein